MHFSMNISESYSYEISVLITACFNSLSIDYLSSLEKVSDFLTSKAETNYSFCLHKAGVLNNYLAISIVFTNLSSYLLKLKSNNFGFISAKIVVE